ncbi:MAG: ATP-grasp domain-containing protein [Betaproteobacteria bacterium]|jgi:predicted ATP-grasp superfamily ATP-dependent carboligase
MKILAYEHITGGAMPRDADMSALAPEGDLMLRALVEDLTAIPGVDVAVMRDARLRADLPAALYPVRSATDFQKVFRSAMRDADAVWPIAPEQDGVLSRVTDQILRTGRTLLGCRPDAVKITTSKRATADLLAHAGVAALPTYVDERSVPAAMGGIVAKPDDGAGCQATRLFRDRSQLRAWLRNNAHAGLVFQNYLEGDPRSLSVLCCDGRARVLACNRQNVRIAGGAFAFCGVSVGAVMDGERKYAALADGIARALPGLWGYCGVDFIETEAGPVVLEVNPRLTTSYAGLRRATGINPAQLVLELPGSLDLPVGVKCAARVVEVEVAYAG